MCIGRVALSSARRRWLSITDVALCCSRRRAEVSVALPTILVLAITLSLVAIFPNAHAQGTVGKITTAGPGKDFKFPDYYPSSNGVRQLKTLVTGSEAQFVSNNLNLVRLRQPRLTNYTPEGKLEWSASSPECIVNVATREVRGSSNMVFQTADEKLFLRGVGFLWQSNNSVLILSNQVFTRIDKSSLTNNASQKK